MNHKMIYAFYKLFLFFILNDAFAKSKEFYDRHNRYHEKGELKIYQKPIGGEVKLRCGLRQHHAEFLSSSNIKWYFKPCIAVSCRNEIISEGVPWTQLMNCDGLPCTNSILILKNLTEKDSGLYNCSAHPYITNTSTLFIQIFRTYQVEVNNPKITPPIFTNDYPLNITTDLNSQAVFQCWVYSKIPPSIKWVKQINENSPLELKPSVFDEDFKINEVMVLSNFERYFINIASAGEKQLYENTYLSKLIINNVSEKDQGNYMCISINFAGYIYRSAYLEVKTLNEENKKNYDFLFLFLIPILFACIPLIICFTYLKIKSKQSKDSTNYLFNENNGNETISYHFTRQCNEIHLIGTV